MSSYYTCCFVTCFTQPAYSEYYISIIIFHSCTVFHCKHYHNLVNQCSIVRYLGYLNLFTVKQNCSGLHWPCIFASSPK